MSGVGTVKAVLSGDTIIITGNAAPGKQAPELQLSLAHLNAPRIARGKEGKDEPFGWPAREFLRKSVVGKQVRFRIDYKVEKISRTFGTVWLLEQPAMSLNKAVVASGWAKVQEASKAPGAGKSDEYDELVALGKAAEESGYGLHNTTPDLAEATVRNIKWGVEAGEVGPLLEALKADPQPAIVENVLNGTTYRVLLTATAPSLAIQFSIAGASAPRVEAPAPGSVAAVTAAAPKAAVVAAVAKATGTGGAAGKAVSVALPKGTLAPPSKPAWGKVAVTPVPIGADIDDVAEGGAVSAVIGGGAAGGGASYASPAPAPAPTPSPRTAAPAPAPTAGSSSSAAASSPAAPTPEALALEAKALAELRLLHRDVLVYFHGEKNGTFYGRLEYVPPASASASAVPSTGDFGVDILRLGYAKFADWTASFLPAANVASLRASERAAKASKLKLWHAHAGDSVSASSAASAALRSAGGDRSSSFEARVLEVVSGDTLVMGIPRPASTSSTPSSTGILGYEERRVSLSSTRAPRLGRRDEKEAPYATEAKDFLRKLLIGKDVLVSLEYVKTAAAAGGAAGGAVGGAGASEGGATAEAATGTGSDRFYGTVQLVNKKGEVVNAAQALVGEGLAEVIRHRASDDDRSAHYDDLLAAEDAAKAGKKGIHSGKEAPSQSSAAKRINDLSGDPKKAKEHLAFLQRAKTMNGTVDFVFAGGRVKVTVPSQNVSFVFGLTGVRCPATARPASKGADGKTRPARAAEPCGAEALSFLREHLLQRDVELEVQDADKGGAIVGTLYVGKGAARRNIAVDILRAGLGTTIPGVIDRAADSADLLSAEAEAKGAKRGVWEHWVEPVAEEEDEGVTGGEEGASPAMVGGGAAGGAGGGAASGTSSGSSSGPAAFVSEIVNGYTFYMQSDRDRTALTNVTARLATLLTEVGVQSAAVETKRGKVVACLFDEGDGTGPKWFRARIEGKSKAGTGKDAATGLDLWDVVYIDYGNKAAVTVQSMRPLDATLANVPALAKEAQLALVRTPALDKEYGNDAAALLSELVFGRRVSVKFLGKDMRTPDKAIVALYDLDTGACVNEEMVASGLARISKNEARRARRRGGDATTESALLEKLEAAQAGVKAKRIGLFAHGDPADSDDEKR